MEAVELRNNQLAIPVVLGSCRLRLLRCTSSSCCSANAGLGRLHHCWLIRAVEFLNQALVKTFERAMGRGYPRRGIVELVAWQPDLLGREGKGAQKGNEPGIGSVRCRMSANCVVRDAKATMLVG